jgi:hypothetical protein
MNTIWSRLAIVSTVVITLGTAIFIYALTERGTSAKVTCGNTCVVGQQDPASFKTGMCKCRIENDKQMQWNYGVNFLPR